MKYSIGDTVRVKARATQEDEGITTTYKRAYRRFECEPLIPQVRTSVPRVVSN